MALKRQRRLSCTRSASTRSCTASETSTSPGPAASAPLSAWADAWAASIARPASLEHSHQAVAEALHDLAAARAYLRLDGGADLAQQGHRLGVAGVERPGGEVREVGEDDRQLAVAAAATLGLGQTLPHLQRAHPDLAQGARQPAAAEPEELDQAGVRVDALEEAAETAGRVLARRADFIYARRASATSRA